MPDNFQIREHSWPCLFHISRIYFNIEMFFIFVIKNTVCDENGRYIICELELSKERIIVTNFFGLNTDNTLLLESFIDDITGAWGMDFVSSSPLFSTTPPFFSKFSYKSFLFQNFHNHSFFLHLTISVDVIHHE